MNQPELNHWADLRHTDHQVAQAIHELARGDAIQMDRIWEHPTAAEQAVVAESLSPAAEPYNWGQETISTTTKCRTPPPGQPPQDQKPNYHIVEDKARPGLYHVENENNPIEHLPSYAQGDFRSSFAANTAVNRIRQDAGRQAAIEQAKRMEGWHLQYRIEKSKYHRGAFLIKDLRHPDKPIAHGLSGSFGSFNEAYQTIDRVGQDEQRGYHPPEPVRARRGTVVAAEPIMASSAATVRSAQSPAVNTPKEEPKMPAKKHQHKSQGKDYVAAHYKDFADRIITQIKAGTAPWQKPWELGDKVLPQSVSTGREYRGGNSLHLMAVASEKGYSDNRWATFEQVKATGGAVRKGEKSTKITWWDFSRTEKKFPVTDQQGRPQLDENGEQVLRGGAPRCKIYSVFNVEQTTGMKLKELVPDKPSWQTHQDADALLKASGVKINHVAGDRAYYALKADAVTLPKPSQFPTAESYYHTANHELGHATGHESRLNRETINEGIKQGFGSETYAREELRAEIAAMMTNTRLGLGHNSMEGAAYVASWVKVIKDDPKEIHYAARDAQKISDHLINPIRERLQQKDQKPDQEQQLEAAHTPVTPTLTQQINTYRKTIPADHIELEAKPRNALPNSPVAYKYEDHPIPQNLKGLTTHDFGYNKIIAHAPKVEVDSHFNSLPAKDRPTLEVGPTR